MIVLDTHIWFWWIEVPAQLSPSQVGHIQAHEQTGLGVSVISCWELAKKFEKGKLTLPCSISHWITQALAYPGIQLISISPEIAVESCQLPQPIHGDPANQSIVATARIHSIPLLTADAKILNYPHVTLLT